MAYNPRGEWKVQKGVIAGISAASEPRHGLLVSDKQYDNFEVEIEYKAVKGNSEALFPLRRSERRCRRVWFPGRDRSRKDAGGLYETGGRAWVAQPKSEDVKKWYKPGTWNTMKVRAVGKDITVWVNGIETAHLTNDPGRSAGNIALQLHGGMDMEVYFKKVRIKYSSLPFNTFGHRNFLKVMVKQ